MIALAWRSVRGRLLSVCGAFLCVVIGASLVTATALISGTGGEQTTTTGWSFDQVDAVVRPQQAVTLTSGLRLPIPAAPRLSGEDMAGIERSPGVKSVSFETPFPAYVVHQRDELVGSSNVRSWGHPWSTGLAGGAELVGGAAPDGPREVVVDEEVANAAGLDVGSAVRVELPSGTQEFVVTGIATWSGQEFEHALFFQTSTAAELGGSPVLALVSTDDVDRLRQSVPDLEVLTGANRNGSLQLDLRQAELAGGSSQFLLVIAMLALMIATFVTSSTLMVSVDQRRREMAMLRLVGARSRSVRRMIVWESAIVSGTGGVVGAALGAGMAELARSFFVAQGLMARGTEIALVPGAFALGVVGALASGLLAAWFPARRVARIPPIEALRESAQPSAAVTGARSAWGWGLLAAGGASLAGSIAIGGPVPTFSGAIALLLLVAAFPLLILASVLLGPAIIRLVLVVTGRSMRRTLSGFVAERSLRADLRRAAGVSVPLTLMVAASVVFLFQDSANFQARSQIYADQVIADVVVTGGPQLGVPMSTVPAIAGLPGVAAASATVSSTLVVDDPATSRATGTVTGVAAESFQRVLHYEVLSGSWDGLSRDRVGVSDVIASDKGWQVGDTIAFRYPDGVKGSAVVAAIFRDPMGVSDVVLPADVLLPHLLEPFASAVYVAGTSGTSAEETVRHVADAVSATAPGALVTDRAGHLEDVALQASGDNWIVLMVVVVLGGYAAISAVNVLVGSVASRRREFALLRLAGARRSRILASLAVEGLVVATVAAAGGSVVAAAVLVGYGHLLTDTIWLPYVGATYAVIVGCAYAVAATGMLLPARAVMQADPLQAIR